jgi:hypothetical protein
MAIQMFRFARKGDEVWDLRYGWGKILDVKGAHPHGSYQFVASFSTRSGDIERTFTIEGIDLKCENQTVFKTEMKLVEK